MKRSFSRVILDQRHRVIVATSAVFLIWILIILSYELYQGYQNENRKAQIITKNTAYILEEHLEGVFKHVDLVLTTIADIIKIRGSKYHWTAQKYHDLLNEKKKSVPGIAVVKIADKQGLYIGHDDQETAKHVNVFDRSYFQSQLKSETAGLFVSEPLMARSLGVPVITLSRRLNDEQGHFLGIVIASVPISYFKNILSKVDVGPHGNITIVTLKDRILVTRFPETGSIQVGQLFKAPAEMEKIISSDFDEGSWYAKSALDPYFKTFSAAKNKQYDFFVSNGLAEVDYLESWKTNLYWSCAGVIILLAGFLYALFRYLLSVEKVEAQQLQVAESAKMSTLGSMAAGIAHEINNPLAIIQSKTEAIKMALESSAPNLVQIHAMLTGIDRTVYRVSKIINSLRSFTRSNSSDRKSEVSIDQIIQNSTNLIYEKYKSAAIILKVAPSPLSKILCDEAQLIEVLLCLLSNSHDALKAQKENRWVDIKFIESKSKLQIVITDSGPGVPDSIAAKIMDPFFTTKPIGQGTGLGLSTAKGIIENYNGRLVYNKNSKHTQFIIEIPTLIFDQLKQA